MSGTKLCSLDEIPENGSAGFLVEIGGKNVHLMAIRKDGDVHIYENECPHVGVPLDFRPGQFLDAEKKHIMCSTHGALFVIETGECIDGPCFGDHLIRVDAEIRDGVVYLS